MKVKTAEAMLAATSFLLGRTHAGIVMALDEELPSDSLDKLKDVEAALRKDIERLYYSNPERQSPE
tara:strand:- start:1025 stop:1222 length:198 start_codon:yes stop_codon:yes gene_type:complete